MSRIKNERLAAKGRPKRRAAKTHFFKYQLAANPTRAEENDLKRALQESLEEQHNLNLNCSPAPAQQQQRINSNQNNNNNNHPGRTIDLSSNRFRVANLTSTPLNINTSSGRSSTQSSSSSSNTSTSTAPAYGHPSSNTTSSASINGTNSCQDNNNRNQVIVLTNNKRTQTPASAVKQLTNTTTTAATTTTTTATKRRSPPGSWSLLGVPEEKVVYLRDDEPPRRLICYPAIKHIEGDVIKVRDSVLLRSGARKTDIPYIAKVCAFWEDPETASVMMSLFWYYRPEHTEDGRKPHHLPDEIFASRHRDVDSVECIDDKCYVLTFNEYCRYRKRCKMEQVNTTWSLADVTIPASNESYPRRSRIPDSDVNPELVFCCRQIYDTKTRRIVKNSLVNPNKNYVSKIFHYKTA